MVPCKDHAWSSACACAAWVHANLNTCVRAAGLLGMHVMAPSGWSVALLACMRLARLQSTWIADACVGTRACAQQQRHMCPSGPVAACCVAASLLNVIGSSARVADMLSAAWLLHRPSQLRTHLCIQWRGQRCHLATSGYAAWAAQGCTSCRCLYYSADLHLQEFRTFSTRKLTCAPEALSSWMRLAHVSLSCQHSQGCMRAAVQLPQAGIVQCSLWLLRRSNSIARGQCAGQLPELGARAESSTPLKSACKP